MNCLRCNNKIIGRQNEWELKFCTRYCQEKYWRDNNKERYKENQSRNYDKYSFGGMRGIVLKRDNYCCIDCGRTNKQHLFIYDCSITVDHIDGNRKNNTLENLQTLCLSCHGRKDGARGTKFSNLSIEMQHKILKNLEKGKYYV